MNMLPRHNITILHSSHSDKQGKKIDMLKNDFCLRKTNFRLNLFFFLRLKTLIIHSYYLALTLDNKSVMCT